MKKKNKRYFEAKKEKRERRESITYLNIENKFKNDSLISFFTDYNIGNKNKILISKNLQLVHIYMDVMQSNGRQFIDRKQNNSLFFNYMKLNPHHKQNQLTDNFVFVTSNSFNPQLSYNEKVSRNKFKYIKQFFPHRKNYVINSNGYILIIINSIQGYYACHMKNDKHQKKRKKGEPYQDFINITFKSLKIVIGKIRKYTDREIQIRFHGKQTTEKKSSIMDQINKFIVDIAKDYEDINLNNEVDIIKLMESSYCVVTQNTKFLFDFVNFGLPIFTSDFYTCDYFPEIYIRDFSIIEKLKQQKKSNFLPDRLSFLMKYYYHFYSIKDLLNRDPLYLLDKFKIIPKNINLKHDKYNYIMNKMSKTINL